MVNLGWAKFEWANGQKPLEIPPFGSFMIITMVGLVMFDTIWFYSVS